MVVFSAIGWAASALMPGFGGALSIFGMSPAVTAAVLSAGRAASWSLASAALSQPKVPRQQVQATISQTDAPRIRGWGKALLGGQRVFFEADDGQLYQIVLMHHGRIDGLIRFWWDGEPVTHDPATGEVERYKYNWFRDGSGIGGDYERVLSEFPTLWTAGHRLQGQATFSTQFGDPSDEDFAKVFPKGPGTVVQAEVRLSRVRDMSGALIYSDNAGLCIRDFMTHRDGWNIPLDRLNTASWQAFVNRSAAAVPRAGGGTEPCYRLAGYYSLDEALKDVTARMLATCDGQIYEDADGLVGILGGGWSEPDVTITAKDILSIEMDEGFDPFTDYNVIKGGFVSPDHGYQLTEVTEWRDEAALITQPERVKQYDVEMCPSSGQLQRLMKIRYAKDHREWVGTLRTNLVGMKARWPKGDGIHTIRVIADEFGINGVFEVTGHAFDIASRSCEIGIASLANPYGWTAAEERPLAPGMEELETPDHTRTPPQNRVVVQQPVTVSGDVKGVKLVVSVDNPGRESLRLQAQVAQGTHAADSATALWVEMAAANYRAESGILDDGQTYTVRVCWRGRSDWIVAATVTALANPTAPPVPTGLSAVFAGGKTALDWRNAATGFHRTQIVRNTSNNSATATVIASVPGVAGQVSDHEDTPTGTGTRYYWARTINPSGVPSAFVGPVTVTI
ncbi:hypothetical protein ACEUZ9_002218 [Paracoccus litorisediminis]|uniref:hypothetical protein n=1 Tax=Paracoccus litorisediminis TaxID=2006130 RepID=UPI003730ED34